MRFTVEELSAGPAGRALIEGLSFSLEAGSRVALVGPSGSGKTTVLRALSWLDLPLAGSLALDGRHPRELGLPAWRRRVLLVSQRAAFFGGAVSEELARPFGFRSAGGDFDEGLARRRLEALGLGTLWDRPAEGLSEGERQRVAFVRALGLEPSVLLLDEPTSALDPEAVEALEALLEGFEGGLVLVSHDRAQRERLGATPIDLAPLRAAP